MLKDEDLLLELVRDAVSDYSCDASDRDFECIIKIECDNGWASAEIVQKDYL